MSSDLCLSHRDSVLASSSGNKGTSLGDGVRWWDDRQKGASQPLILLLGTPPGSQPQVTRRSKVRRGSGQDETPQQREDSFPRCKHPVSASWLDTPCLFSCWGLSFCLRSFRTQWLADFGIYFHHHFKANGICRIPSWLALMWGDFPLPNDR